MTLLPEQTDQPMTLALQPARMKLLATTMTTNFNQVSVHKLEREDSRGSSISDLYTGAENVEIATNQSEEDSVILWSNHELSPPSVSSLPHLESHSIIILYYNMLCIITLMMLSAEIMSILESPVATQTADDFSMEIEDQNLPESTNGKNNCKIDHQNDCLTST